MNKFTREKSLSLSLENGNDSLHSDNDQVSLALSPIVSTQEYLSKNSIKYKSIFDKTRINNRFFLI